MQRVTVAVMGTHCGSHEPLITLAGGGSHSSTVTTRVACDKLSTTETKMYKSHGATCLLWLAGFGTLCQ